MKNIFYFDHINTIGGVETFFWNIARTVDKDMTIYYKQGDPEQIARLRERVRVVKWDGQDIKCEKAFFNYAAGIIDHVDAEEYTQIIHCDYAAQGLRPTFPEKITRYVGVSQTVCDSFTKLTGFPCECYYPPVPKPEHRKVVRLVSATRLSKEKGADRMQRLADLLDATGLPYEWDIYTNSKETIKSPNVTYRKPTLDIADRIAGATYLVQLSDTEAFCFSVVESLMMSVPAIVTDLPVWDEIGLTDENSIRLSLDFTDAPVDEIFKGKKKFKYAPPESKFGDLLAPGKRTYDPDAIVTVECVKRFWDLVDNVQREVGDTWETKQRRADMLQERGLTQ